MALHKSFHSVVACSSCDGNLFSTVMHGDLWSWLIYDHSSYMLIMKARLTRNNSWRKKFYQNFCNQRQSCVSNKTSLKWEANVDVRRASKYHLSILHLAPIKQAIFCSLERAYELIKFLINFYATRYRLTSALNSKVFGCKLVAKRFRMIRTLTIDVTAARWIMDKFVNEIFRRIVSRLWSRRLCRVRCYSHECLGTHIAIQT